MRLPDEGEWLVGRTELPPRDVQASHDEESAPRFVAAWAIATRSGSRYLVGRDARGVWWFGGRNIPNPRSVLLPERLYRIEEPTPWPPLLGIPMCLIAARDLAITDPRRAPGGGKVTSPVDVLLEVPAGDLRPMSDGDDD